MGVITTIDNTKASCPSYDELLLKEVILAYCGTSEPIDIEIPSKPDEPTPPIITDPDIPEEPEIPVEPEEPEIPEESIEPPTEPEEPEPEPGTGDADDDGGDSGSDMIHEFVWVNTPMRSAVGSFEEATEDLFTRKVSEGLESYRQEIIKRNTGTYNTVVEPIGEILVEVQNATSYLTYYDGPLSELTFDKIIQNRDRSPEFLYGSYTKNSTTGGYWYHLLISISFRFSVYFKISGNLYSDNSYKEGGQVYSFYATVSPLWEIARTRAERQRWLDNYND